jgi:hypothetical protein
MGITQNSCAIPPTRKNIHVEGLLPIILEDNRYAIFLLLLWQQLLHSNNN